MADWTDQEVCLDYMITQYVQAYQEWGFMWASYPYVQGFIDAGQYAAALQELFYMVCCGMNAIGNLVRRDTDYIPTALIPYYFKNYGTVSWKTIVEAWVKDDFEGRGWTIAVIDRMRQLLWNEPFSVVWAARPEDKEIPE